LPKTVARDKQLELVIDDDGCGISQGALRKIDSFGVCGMRERAVALGGKLWLENNQDAGTSVHLMLPLCR